MKKTTKILLVLAAVVAMAIGAVSTVMAADEYPEIAEWNYNSSTKKYSAKDADGETIVRGWATDEGRWYFFDSSVMLVNTFVTSDGEIYYLDNNGCMAVGWIEFAGDAEVTAVDKYTTKFANVASITGFNDVFEVDATDALGKDLFTNVFTKKTTYATLWCYFDESGAMAHDEWVCAWDIWYYMYGPYCVMNNYSVAIDNDGDDAYNDGDDGIYGFGKDGAMLVGWNSYDNGDAVKDSTYDADSPYESSKTGSESTLSWTWYDANGRQVNTKLGATVNSSTSFEGWEKINGTWYYFVDDTNIGVKVLQNTMLYIKNGDASGSLKDDGKCGVFYLDEDGALVTGVKTFEKKASYGVWNGSNVAGAAGTAGTKVTLTAATTFYFRTATGSMQDSDIGNYYYIKAYDNNTDVVYLVEDADITTDASITLDDSTSDLTTSLQAGQRIEGKNFIVALTDTDGTYGSKGNVVYLYFESGKLQKNQAITFGCVTLAIDSYGKIITKTAGETITIRGIKYTFDSTYTFDLASDASFNRIVK